VARLVSSAVVVSLRPTHCRRNQAFSLVVAVPDGGGQVQQAGAEAHPRTIEGVEVDGEAPASVLV
jgi:hypothetical protein